MSCGFYPNLNYWTIICLASNYSALIYYSHCCMCLFGKIVLKYCLFFVWYDLIFVCKMILLGRAYQNILFGNLNIFGKYLTQGLFLSTHLFIRPVCLIKLFIKIEAFCVTHCWICVFVFTTYHTPYVYVATTTYPILHVNASY